MYILFSGDQDNIDNYGGVFPDLPAAIKAAEKEEDRGLFCKVFPLTDDVYSTEG